MLVSGRERMNKKKESYSCFDVVVAAARRGQKMIHSTERHRINGQRAKKLISFTVVINFQWNFNYWNGAWAFRWLSRLRCQSASPFDLSSEAIFTPFLRSAPRAFRKWQFLCRPPPPSTSTTVQNCKWNEADKTYFQRRSSEKSKEIKYDFQTPSSAPRRRFHFCSRHSTALQCVCDEASKATTIANKQGSSQLGRRLC